jgi:muconolactone delta-isomerase
MKILAFERELPGATAERFQRHAKEEARAAWKLHQAGIIRELYFRADQHTAVLVLECESMEEAASVLSTLPFVVEGLIQFDLVPLVAYSGFARLFEQETP